MSSMRVLRCSDTSVNLWRLKLKCMNFVLHLHSSDFQYFICHSAFRVCILVTFTNKHTHYTSMHAVEYLKPKHREIENSSSSFFRKFVWIRNISFNINYLNIFFRSLIHFWHSYSQRCRICLSFLNGPCLLEGTFKFIPKNHLPYLMILASLILEKYLLHMARK